MSDTPTTTVDVLVVGGGLGGLSTTMNLARWGVSVLMVEKHPTTSVQPRAIGQNPRTMELLDVAGVADEVRRAGAAGGEQDHFTTRVVESVRGTVLGVFRESFDDLVTATAPCAPQPWALAFQDQIEPIMLARATELGAQTAFRTELVSYEQDVDGVTAVLSDRVSGERRQVRARYLVAADGDHSRIREGLGIPRHGLGVLSNVVSCIFEADLAEILPPEASGLYYLRNPQFSGVFIGSVRPQRHTFLVEYHPERGESPEDFPPQRFVKLLRIALDAPDLEPRILDVQRWEMAALVAERWRSGRVFLVGDAAKVTPPTGGLGGNTAIGDGYDLAWKLAAVVSGQAGTGLLDAYEPERRHVAQLVVDEALGLYADRLAPHLTDQLPRPIGYARVILGFRYRSGAVLEESAAVDDADTEDPQQPSGRPGFRAPHLWVYRDGTRISTVGLFGNGWTVITGADGHKWVEAAQHVATDLGVALPAYRVGADVTGADDDVHAAYGIGTTGASLIRPDGVVAWRTDTTPDDPHTVLRSVLARVLSR
ncbi:aklavinone 12-hydroxylase RdmE [Micromonospora ureilytica]|uniref:aklavinone 12-hydroxylase RdmE n=1 Tax=Micromonospora ureilytica TaxID=709868 RepID=UPI0033E780EE